jgi:hypothetical protein
MRRRNFLKLGPGAAIGGALAACGTRGTDTIGGQPERLAGTVVGWNRVALQAIRSAQPEPPMAARSLAILHTCMYNAWAAYDDNARQTVHGVAVRLPRAERSAASKASAMSHAAHLALADQFPAQRAAFDAWMAGLGLDPARPSGQLSPAGIGRTQAASMLDFCHRNGANRLGDLAPDRQAYADHAGYVPWNPPMLATDPAAAGGIVELRQNLGEEQKAIAAYWADGPGTALPPGHWYLLAQHVSERDRHDDDQDVRLFFALANALSDAAIARWDPQRAYDAARPLTARLELEREVGAPAFDKARRYWEGRL